MHDVLDTSLTPGAVKKISKSVIDISAMSDMSDMSKSTTSLIAGLGGGTGGHGLLGGKKKKKSESKQSLISSGADSVEDAPSGVSRVIWAKALIGIFLSTLGNRSHIRMVVVVMYWGRFKNSIEGKF